MGEGWRYEREHEGAVSSLDMAERLCNTLDKFVLQMEASMAKSVRLDSQLESRLERAARALGISQSELIREAVAKRCKEVVRPSLAERLAPFIGCIKTSGGRARHTGVAFRRALAKKRAR